MRIEDRHEGATAYQSNTRACELQGCPNVTREGKPFCPEHVDLNPHALRVTQEIAQREAEDAIVAKGDTPVSGYNVRGLTAQAILQDLIEHGTRTKARICRELSLERSVLDGYVEALVEKGLIAEGLTQRGSETLSLRRPASCQSHP